MRELSRLVAGGIYLVQDQEYSTRDPDLVGFGIDIFLLILLGVCVAISLEIPSEQRCSVVWRIIVDGGHVFGKRQAKADRAAEGRGRGIKMLKSKKEEHTVA